MGFLDFIQAVFALAFTLGLVALGALALRRYGPNALARFGQPQRRDRRMKVVETLILDPARRLLIVECDGQEKLLLLGEGRLLGETRVSPQASTTDAG